jgi:hypothetical protein
VPPEAPDAERDRLAAALGRHYVEGRIDAGELDRRLTAVYDAAPAPGADPLAGLPPLGPAAPPPRRRRGRRHAEAETADPAWRPTRERFVDPTTERVMRVWVDPADHRRHYVAEERS